MAVRPPGRDGGHHGGRRGLRAPRRVAGQRVAATPPQRCRSRGDSKRPHAACATRVRSPPSGTGSRPAAEARRARRTASAGSHGWLPLSQGGQEPALHGGCRTNRSEIRHVDVPWDATMQGVRASAPRWDDSRAVHPKLAGASHALVQRRIHRLCATASMESPPFARAGRSRPSPRETRPRLAAARARWVGAALATPTVGVATSSGCRAPRSRSRRRRRSRIRGARRLL